LLYEGRGRLDGEHRVRLDSLPVSRHVDDGERLAGDRMADRCPGADPGLPGRNVVFRADDLDGPTLCQGRADAVRTGGLFVPAPAPADAWVDLSTPLDARGMTDGREHVPSGATRGEHVLRPAELPADPRERGATNAQPSQPPPPLAPLALGQHARASLERRIH